jgi:DNA helicase-2/ATP-dependent DNA helicase PcrA
MEDGVFPGMQTMTAGADELEEERRLAYVAITRAREQVILLHTRTRLWYGQTVSNPLSRFAREIPDECILHEDLTLEGMSKAMGGTSATQTAAPTTNAGYYERPRRQKAPVHTDRLTIGQPAPTVTGEARKTMNDLAPGDRVLHATFGEGEILSVKPMGADRLFEVMFDTAGTKKMMGTYAKLKKL